MSNVNENKVSVIYNRRLNTLLKKNRDILMLRNGDEVIKLTKPNLWGANFAIKSSMFQKYGYFYIICGRKQINYMDMKTQK